MADETKRIDETHNGLAPKMRLKLELERKCMLNARRRLRELTLAAAGDNSLKMEINACRDSVAAALDHLNIALGLQ